MTAPTPQTALRWGCRSCEYETTYPRPPSRDALKEEMGERSCPQCGEDEEYWPTPFVMTQVFYMMKETGHQTFAGPDGDDPATALEGTEVGTFLSQNHPLMDPPEDPHTCVCDWCGAEIGDGEMLTMYAFRHPETEDPDTWVLYELYCEACDVDSLLIGSALTHDVLLHGYLVSHGEMYVVENLAVIADLPPGERITL